MKRFLTILSAAALLLSCQREEFPGGNDPSRRIVTSEAASVTETSAVLKGYANLPDDGTYYRYGIVVSTDKTPTAGNGQVIEARGTDADHQFSCQATGLLMAQTYYFRAYLLESGRYQWGKTYQFTTKDFTEGSLEAVDLGLSVKWGSCNLGAAGPFDSGDYFAWGETVPKKDYSRYTYAWVNGDEFTKYNREDEKTLLDPSDDAATVALGGNWRTPTYEEFRELLSCERTRTGRKGVVGFLITGPSGKRIFLPATGEYILTDLVNVGSRGCYWTTLRTPDPYYARLACINSGSLVMTYLSRYHGHSIRPVSD